MPAGETGWGEIEQAEGPGGDGDRLEPLSRKQSKIATAGAGALGAALGDLTNAIAENEIRFRKDVPEVGRGPAPELPEDAPQESFARERVALANGRDLNAEEDASEGVK